MGEAVIDEGTAPLGAHQPRLSENAQVERRVGLLEPGCPDHIRYGSAFHAQAAQNSHAIGFPQQPEELRKSLYSGFGQYGEWHMSGCAYE